MVLLNKFEIKKFLFEFEHDLRLFRGLMDIIVDGVSGKKNELVFVFINNFPRLFEALMILKVVKLSLDVLLL